MTKADCFELGYIARTHGLDGRLAVVFDVDDPSVYANIGALLLEIKGELVPYVVTSLQFMANKIVAKFEDVNHIDQAEPLKGTRLFLPLEKLPALNEGQFYYHDLIGYELHDNEEGNVGVVKLIYNMPGQDLLAVEHKGVEVLVPINDDILKRIDHAAKIIHADLPGGLLDIYLQP
jgi:16S rRNA processing protein RimM